MKRSTKIAAILSGILVLVGVVTMVGGLALVNFDIRRLNMARAESVTFSVEQPFEHIVVEGQVGNVRMEQSEDGFCRVVCKASKGFSHSAVAENGTLTVKQKDVRRWYEHIGIFWEVAEIVIYLPTVTLGDVTVSTDTGNVTLGAVFSLENVKVQTDTGNVTVLAEVRQALKADTDTGNIRIENSRPASLAANTDTGNITLQNVVVNGDVHIRASTGNVKLEYVDGENLRIRTSTGSVTGKVLTDKVFVAESSTGKVEVPHTRDGGTCQITTGTGNIRIVIQQPE